MKRFFASLTLALVVALGAAPAWAANPAMAPINAAIAAMNAGDRAALVTEFTHDATIVDDFAPYYFTSSAPGRWYDGFVKDAKANHVVPGTIVIHTPKFVHMTSTAAWIVVPTDYPYTHNGKSELETGSLVFTVTRAKGIWKITSMSWAALTDSMAP